VSVWSYEFDRLAATLRMRIEQVVADGDLEDESVELLETL
jgi:hypothetical protein